MNALLVTIVSFQIITGCLGTREFPDNFRFGADTASFAIEGAWKAGGKQQNMFDLLLQYVPDMFVTNSGGNATKQAKVAADSYHKYKNDIKAAKKIGLDFYRFSISLPRLCPDGCRNSANPAGAKYYNNVINAVIAANLTPVVTLIHYDTSAGEDFVLGGFSTDESVEVYTNYADLVFRLYADRVHHWITFNAPYKYCKEIYGDLYGKYFDSFPTGRYEYTCGHNILKAHAKIYKLYHSKYEGDNNEFLNSMFVQLKLDFDTMFLDFSGVGLISIANVLLLVLAVSLGHYEINEVTLIGLNVSVKHCIKKQYRLWKFTIQIRTVALSFILDWYEPATHSPEDIEAAKRAMDFHFGWFAHPLIHGNYPQRMIDTIAKISKKQNYSSSRLPPFTKKEIEEIKGTLDYVPLAPISTYLVCNNEKIDATPSASNDVQITKRYKPEWIDPNNFEVNTVCGFRKAVKYVWKEYKQPLISILSQGYGAFNDSLNDTFRIQFLKKYLKQVLLLINEDKINIRSYSVWSLIDLFYFQYGYKITYGLVQVDYNQPQRPRVLKKSACYYSKVIESRKL